MWRSILTRVLIVAKNRKAVEDQIIKDLNEISPGCVETKLYREYFASMSDKAFDEFMVRLKEGKEWLTLTAENGNYDAINISRNYKVADKWGVKFHQRLWMPEDGDTPAWLTPNEYLILLLPIRIPSQRLTKKASIPKHQRVINAITGQPTGDSKGASMSMPELRLLMAMGLKHSAVELMKYRGGDVRGYAAMNASLTRTGKARQASLEPFATGVRSTDTVKAYFTSAHIKTTL